MNTFFALNCLVGGIVTIALTSLVYWLRNRTPYTLDERMLSKGYEVEKTGVPCPTKGWEHGTVKMETVDRHSRWWSKGVVYRYPAQSRTSPGMLDNLEEKLAKFNGQK